VAVWARIGVNIGDVREQFNDRSQDKKGMDAARLSYSIYSDRTFEFCDQDAAGGRAAEASAGLPM